MYNNFKGKFTPKNPEKYSGNVKKIIYRSSWERLLMVYCDKKDQILQWSSEEYKIPYVFEGKNRTYYPDFWIEMVDHTGEIQEKDHRDKTSLSKEVEDQQGQVETGEKFAKENHMTFEVMTEKELF